MRDSYPPLADIRDSMTEADLAAVVAAIDRLTAAVERNTRAVYVLAGITYGSGMKWESAPAADEALEALIAHQQAQP